MALPVCLLVLSIISLCSSSQLPGPFQNNGNQFQSPFTFVRDDNSGGKVPSHGHAIQTRTEIIESKPVFIRHEFSPDVKDIEEFHLQHNSEEQRLKTGVEFQPFHNSQEADGKRLRTGQQFNNKVDFIKSFNNIHVSDEHLLTAGQALENQENEIQQIFSNQESAEEKSRTFSSPQIQENVVHFNSENKESEAQILTFPQQLLNQVNSFQRSHSDLESEDEKFRVGQQIQSQFVVIPNFQNNRDFEEQRVITDQQFQNQAIASHALHENRELQQKRLKSNKGFQVHINQAQHFRAHVPSKTIENTVPFNVIRTFANQPARTHQPFQNKAIALQAFRGGQFQVHSNQAQHFRNPVSSKEIDNDIPLSIVKTLPVFRDVVAEVSNFQSKDNADETFNEEVSAENHEVIGSSNILQGSPSFIDTGRPDERLSAVENIHMTDSEEESERWFRHHQKKFFDSLVLENKGFSDNQFQSFDKTIKLNSVGHTLNPQNLLKQNSQSVVDQSVESLNDRAVIQDYLLQQSHQPITERQLKLSHEKFSNSQESSQQNFEDSQELLSNHNLKSAYSSENVESRTIPDEEHVQSFGDSSQDFEEPKIIVQQNLDSLDQSNKWFNRYQQGHLAHPVQKALFIRMEDHKKEDDQNDHSVHVQGKIDNHDHNSESKEKFVTKQNDNNFQPSFHSFPGNNIQHQNDHSIHVQGEIDNHDHNSESKEKFVTKQNDNNFQPSFHSFPGNNIQHQNDHSIHVQGEIDNHDHNSESKEKFVTKQNDNNFQPSFHSFPGNNIQHQNDHSIHVQGEIDNHDHNSESKEKFFTNQNDNNFQPSFHSFSENKFQQEVQNPFLNTVVQPTFQSHVEYFSQPKQKAHPRPQLISQPYFQPHNSLPLKQTFSPQLIKKSNFQSQSPQINTLPSTTNLQFRDQSNHHQKSKISFHPKFEDEDILLFAKKPQTYTRAQLPNSNLLESREETYIHRNQLSQFPEPIEYKYKFTVHDSRRGTNFGKEEERLGLNTQGYYYVHLPDGRLQKVSYFVEGESGYKADVQYDGKATFSKSNVYYK